MPLSGWELTLVTLWIPVVFVVRGVATYLNTYFIQLVGTRVLESIRLDFFRKLQILPLSFSKELIGRSASRGLADANQLQVTLTTVANEIVKSPASLIGSIGFVAYTAYTEQGVALVLVTLAVVPLSVLPIRYVGKKLIKRAGQIQAELGGVTTIFSENLSATKEVRAFSLETRDEPNAFAVASQTLIRAQMKFMKYEKALTPLIEIISAVGIAFTLLYAYKVHLAQETFITLITALYASYEPIKKLGSLNNEMKRGLGAFDRLRGRAPRLLSLSSTPSTLTPAPRPRPAHV